MMKRIHFSERPLTLSGLRNVKQPPWLVFKPEGLWYTCGDMNWRDFVEFEPGAGDLYALRHAYRIVFSPLARVCRLRTIAGVKRLWQKYGDIGVDPVDGGRMLTVRWARVSRDYDAIECCELYPKDVKATHLDKSADADDITFLSPWDVQSGCVWRKRAIARLVEIAP